MPAPARSSWAPCRAPTSSLIITRDVSPGDAAFSRSMIPWSDASTEDGSGHAPARDHSSVGVSGRGVAPHTRFRPFRQTGARQVRVGHDVPVENHTTRPHHVAVVGSGPSGFYAAAALLDAELDVRVDMFDRLATPWGLVRAGVAPDHPKIKSVSGQYDKTAQREGFRFF